MSEWISVMEALPNNHKYCALMDTRSYANNGNRIVNNEHMVKAGYLTSIGGIRFWSCHGERGVEIDSFTHWMQLPDPPEDK